MERDSLHIVLNDVLLLQEQLQRRKSSSASTENAQRQGICSKEEKQKCGRARQENKEQAEKQRVLPRQGTQDNTTKIHGWSLQLRIFELPISSELSQVSDC